MHKKTLFLFVGYRERLTFPIFTIAATGDELFLVEENKFWWDGIPSTSKYLL